MDRQSCVSSSGWPTPRGYLWRDTDSHHKIFANVGLLVPLLGSHGQISSDPPFQRHAGQREWTGGTIPASTVWE